LIVPSTVVTVLGIPVSIDAGFVAVSMLIGLRVGVAGALVTAALLLASLLAHELAHALLIRRFGGRPRILLRAYGGASLGMPEGISRGRQACAILAGPAVSLLIALAASLGARSLPGRWGSVAGLLAWLNFGWLALSMIPLPAADGGRLLAAALGPDRRWLGALLSLGVVVGAAIGVIAIARSPLVLIGAGCAVAVVVQEVRLAHAAQADRRAALVESLRAGERALAAGRIAEARQEARAVLDSARTIERRADAARLLVAIELAAEDGPAARTALAAMPSGSVDPMLFAAVADLSGDAEVARQMLAQAREAGQLDAAGVRLLLELHGRAGCWDEVVRVTIASSSLLSEGELEQVARALRAARSSGAGPVEEALAARGAAAAR
jgi:hypothetical protein